MAGAVMLFALSAFAEEQSTPPLKCTAATCHDSAVPGTAANTAHPMVTAHSKGESKVKVKAVKAEAKAKARDKVKAQEESESNSGVYLQGNGFHRPYEELQWPFSSNFERER